MKRWDPPDQGGKTVFAKQTKGAQPVEKSFKLGTTGEGQEN